MQSMNAWDAMSAVHKQMDCRDLQSIVRWTAGNHSPCLQSTTHGLRMPTVHRTLDCRHLQSTQWTAYICSPIRNGLHIVCRRAYMDCRQLQTMRAVHLQWTACLCSPSCTWTAVDHTATCTIPTQPHMPNACRRKRTSCVPSPTGMPAVTNPCSLSSSMNACVGTASACKPSGALEVLPLLDFPPFTPDASPAATTSAMRA